MNFTVGSIRKSADVSFRRPFHPWSGFPVKPSPIALRAIREGSSYSPGVHVQQIEFTHLII